MEVKHTSYGPQEITPKYLAAVAAGAPPDVFHAPGYVPPDFAVNKVIVPLDEMVKLDPTTYKNFDAITIYGGRRYGVPVNGGLGCMLYNLELLEKAGLDPKKLPETWDELLAAATRMTSAADNQWGLMLGNKPGFTTAQNFWAFLTGAGGEFFTPDGKASAFNSEAGLETLAFMADNVRARKISPQKSYTDVEAWNEWGTRKVGLGAPLSGLHRQHPGDEGAQHDGAAAEEGPARGPLRRELLVHLRAQQEQGGRREVLPVVGPAGGERPLGGRERRHPQLPGGGRPPGYREFLAQNPLGQAFLDTIPDARPFPGVVGLPAVLQIVSEMVESAGDRRRAPEGRPGPRRHPRRPRAQARPESIGGVRLLLLYNRCGKAEKV